MISSVTNVKQNEYGEFYGKIIYEGKRYTVYKLPANVVEGDVISFDIQENRAHTGCYAIFTGFVNENVENEETSLLDIISEHEVVCWYPSSGCDFTPTIFFSEIGCSNLNIPVEENQEFPDLFIFTDISPNDVNFRNPYINNGNNISRLNDIQGWRYISKLYDEAEGKILVNSAKKLSKLNIETDCSILQNYLVEDCINDNIGNCYYFDVTVKAPRNDTNTIEEWNTTIVYVISENRGFAKDFILSNNVNIDYVSVVRYGNSMGGGSNISPAWIRSILGNINCIYYICNGCYERKASEEELECFGNLNLIDTELERIAEIGESHWSGYASVIWNKVN